MKKNFVIGLGLGMIVIAIVFYGFFLISQGAKNGLNIQTDTTKPTNLIEQTTNMSQDEIINKAKDLGMVFSEEQTSRTLTEDEIVAIAQQIGMVFQSEASKENQETQESKKQEETKATEITSPTENNVVNSDFKVIAVDITGKEVVDVKIQAGLTSGRIALTLQEKGLVDSYIDFNNYVVSKGLETQMRAGNYLIPKNSTYQELLSILVSTPNNNL